MSKRPDAILRHFRPGGDHEKELAKKEKKSIALDAHVLFFKEQKAALAKQSLTARVEAPSGLFSNSEDELAKLLRHLYFMAEAAMPLHRHDIFVEYVVLYIAYILGSQLTVSMSTQVLRTRCARGGCFPYQAAEPHPACTSTDAAKDKGELKGQVCVDCL